MLTLTTNHHVRPLRSLAELPEAARRDFDYIEGDDVHTPRLVQYRGSWWDTADTEPAPDDLRRQGFDGWASTSFWDGVAFRYWDAEGNALDYGDGIVCAYVQSVD
jgi:hypothetical protein